MAQCKIETCPQCETVFAAEPGNYFYDEKKDISFCKEECYVAKNKKKPRRSKAEIAQAKEEKAQAKVAAKEKYAHEHIKLVPGVLPDARAAMKIFENIRLNGNINRAFRRMMASRKIFNPRENINKFMTGGVAEEVVHQLIRSVGFDSQNVSAKASVIDLMMPVLLEPSGEVHSFQVSLKNSGKLGASPILENYRGKKRDEIRPLPPTLIIYTEVDIKRVRIVYLDHEILRQAYPELSDDEFNQEVFKNEDSNLTFKSGFLPHFIPRLPDEYILNAVYPEDLPELDEKNIILLALAEVDRQLGL
jgi:hypothetical protein